jgi:type II secretory ATPase GspE/PulE/Tfp pilus assembly ATPase PilB-like protein
MVVNPLRNVGVVLDPSVKFWRGKKCGLCNGEGFEGCIGVHVLLVASQRVKDAIAKGADAVELRQAARDGSHVSLTRYATCLLTQGLTEASELLRILPREQT